MKQGALGLNQEQDSKKQPLIFNDANEELVGKLFFKSLMIFQKVSKLVVLMIPKLILYSILSYTYLTIYDAWGFEKAIILLLVGVVVFAIRTNNR